MEERERRPWFRGGLPWWAWTFLIFTRLAMLLPLVLLVAGLWWWSHGGAREAPKLVKRAAQHVHAWSDSLFGRSP